MASRALADPMSKPIDQFLPWIIVAAFVALAVLLGWFVNLAVSTQPGVVTEHAYEKGMAYNDVIAADERQSASGLQARVEAKALPGQTILVRLVMTDARGQPIALENASVHLVRPTSSGHDRVLPVTAAALGAGARVPAPLPGLWDIHVRGEAAGVQIQRHVRVIVP